MHLPFKIFSHNLQCISGPNIRDGILSLICRTQNRIFRARRTLRVWNGRIWLQCMTQHIKPTIMTQCCTKRCRLALTFSLWYWTVILYFTTIQTGRSRVRFPIMSLEFFSDILLVALWPWGQISLWQKWVPGVFPGGKGGRCIRLTTLPPSCAVVLKSGNLNFLEPSGPLQACNGTALPFTNIIFYLNP